MSIRESTQAMATRQTNIWVSIDTALARMNRPRPAMTCLRAGGSYSYSVALRIIDCNNPDAQPLVFVELRCPLDGDVPASAAIFCRRRHIPRTSLVAAPAPYIPSRPPRNHSHKTGEMTRQDGELASWRRGGVSPPFLVWFLQQEGGEVSQSRQIASPLVFGACAGRCDGIALRDHGTGLTPFASACGVAHGPRLRRRVGL